MYTLIDMCIYIYTYTYTSIYTHIYIYTHILVATVRGTPSTAATRTSRRSGGRPALRAARLRMYNI